MPPDQTCAHFTHVTRMIFEAQTQVRMCLLYSSLSVPDAAFMPCVFCCVPVYSLAWIRRISCVPHCKSRQAELRLE